MNKRILAVAAAVTLALAGATGCSTTMSSTGGADPSVKRQSIDANVDGALSRLYEKSPGARELVSKARGTLVFPSVVSAGFVVGGSYGQGALRMRGAPEEYYSLAAGSVGLLAGADSKVVVLLFMTQEALDKFESSKGWTVGADAGVTLVTVAANVEIDSKTAQQAIIGFVMTNGGLMANVSLEGAKFSRLML
ncbi:MAG TPA: YSC84-related protein [Caldimonas sp.]